MKLMKSSSVQIVNHEKISGFKFENTNWCLCGENDIQGNQEKEDLSCQTEYCGGNFDSLVIVDES